MVPLATQDNELAIVLALANSLAEKCDLSPERSFRLSLPELLALPKDKLLKSIGMFCRSTAARYRNLEAYLVRRVGSLRTNVDSLQMSWVTLRCERLRVSWQAPRLLLQTRQASRTTSQSSVGRCWSRVLAAVGQRVR